MSTFYELTTVLAQAAPQPASPVFMIGMIVIMFAFMYLFTIRPQKQREKKHLEAVSNLKRVMKSCWKGEFTVQFTL